MGYQGPGSRSRSTGQENWTPDEPLASARDLEILREKLTGKLKGEKLTGEKDRVPIGAYLEELRDAIDRGHKVAYELEDRLGGVLRPYSAAGSAERDSFMDDDLSPMANQIRHLVSMQLALNDRLQETIERLEL